MEDIKLLPLSFFLLLCADGTQAKAFCFSSLDSQEFASSYASFSLLPYSVVRKRTNRFLGGTYFSRSPSSSALLGRDGFYLLLSFSLFPQ